MSYVLPETELVKIKTEKKGPNQMSFIFEALAPGYGLTIGHALRRTLLSSLSGAAITEVRIEGVAHEFSTLPGVKEDIIEIILNLKNLRLKLIGEEPAVLKLSKKGPGEVKAGDFAKNAQVEIIDPNYHIATLDKKGKLNMEATVKKGRGYEPVEARETKKLPLGTIAIDSIFTPIKKIHYDVQNMRVGRRTDFDRLVLDITTDGSLEPEEALKKASQILIDHLGIIQAIKTEDKKGQPKLVEEKKSVSQDTKTKKKKTKKGDDKKKTTSKKATKSSSQKSKQKKK